MLIAALVLLCVCVGVSGGGGGGGRRRLSVRRVIHVLVSNRGGLPETVDGKHSCIVNDYLNPQIWKEKIENFL